MTNDLLQGRPVPVLALHTLRLRLSSRAQCKICGHRIPLGPSEPEHRHRDQSPIAAWQGQKHLSNQALIDCCVHHTHTTTHLQPMFETLSVLYPQHATASQWPTRRSNDSARPRFRFIPVLNPALANPVQWANLLSLKYEYMHLLVTTQIRCTIEFTGIEIMPLHTAFAVALKILRGVCGSPGWIRRPGSGCSSSIEGANPGTHGARAVTGRNCKAP